MRKAKADENEILAVEKAKDDRRRQRARGFKMMDVRDSGWNRFSNGTEILWYVPEERREEGVAYMQVPDGMFVLKIGNKTALFDAEEFRRSLRWV